MVGLHAASRNVRPARASRRYGCICSALFVYAGQQAACSRTGGVSMITPRRTEIRIQSFAPTAWRVGLGAMAPCNWTDDFGDCIDDPNRTTLTVFQQILGAQLPDQ